MAEPVPSAGTAEAKPRNKIRTIRIWLWVTALLFAGTFFLSQCAMSKPRAKAEIIEACVKNGPFNPRWEDELAQHGLQGQSERVIVPYCQCMWNEPLEAMDTQAIENFSKLSATDQLQQLGGEAAVIERHRQCLRQQAGT